MYNNVWYVRDGVMCSGRVIAKLNFAYEVVDSNKQHDPRYLGYFMKGNGDTTNSIPRGLINMADRPGVWYLVSGMEIVHCDDVYLSRRAAAEAEFERLMSHNSDEEI